jgi:hypothetical protein
MAVRAPEKSDPLNRKSVRWARKCRLFRKAHFSEIRPRGQRGRRSSRPRRVGILRRVAVGDEAVERFPVLRLALLALERFEGLSLLVQLFQRFALMLFVRGVSRRGALPAGVPGAALQAAVETVAPAEATAAVAPGGAPNEVDQRRDAERLEDQEGDDDAEDLARPIRARSGRLGRLWVRRPAWPDPCRTEMMPLIRRGRRSRSR